MANTTSSSCWRLLWPDCGVIERQVAKTENAKIVEELMMPDALFVDPSAATGPVISVGGRCYSMAGDSSNAPDTFIGDIGGTFSTCDKCDGPAPCGCPADWATVYPSSYIVTFSAGGYTDTFGHVIAWDASTATISIDAETCTWLGGYSVFHYTVDGVDNTADWVALRLQSCKWTITVSSVDRGFFFTTAFGGAPDLGNPYHLTYPSGGSGTASVSE